MRRRASGWIGARGWRVFALTAVTGFCAVARAYDFTIDLRTIGQGYQVRQFAPDGSNQLLSRRRLTQYLDVNVAGIEPDSWRGDDGGRNQLYFDASLRLDSDFGGYTLGAPTGAQAIAELSQNQLDILYAFLGGRAVGGRVDFQLGRQLRFDLIDFFAFDGGDVVVHLPRRFSVEAFAGSEVRGELPLSSPIYELDGTSAGSHNPATRPDQDAALHPLVGAAIADGAERGPYFVRLAYRETWSATADRQPGEPATGVDEEALALTASAAWRDRVYVSGGARYNLLLAEFDDEQLAVRVRFGRRQWLTLEHVYLAPTFDGDSIWNVFSTGAYRDLRASYELGAGAGVTAYARAFARFYSETDDEVATAGPFAGQDVGAAAPGGRFAAGGSLGAVWRRARGMARVDGYWDDGYGGRKLGVDASARAQVGARFEVEGRLTTYYWRSDVQPAIEPGVVFGAQAGGRCQIGQGLRLHVVAEDNVDSFYTSQYRGLVVFEMDASL